MSPAMDLLQRARAIRERLRHPPNAVPDYGIDLRRKRIPPTAPELVPTLIPTPPPIIDCYTATVRIVEIGNIPRPIKFARILRLVALYYRVKVEDIIGRSRQQICVLPRHVAIYLGRKYCSHKNRTTGKLGMALSRDHTTIVHAYLRIEDLMLINKCLAEDVHALETILFSP